MAIALIAHWARETGWGDSERSFNVGNIRALNWDGDYEVLPDGLDYRAYASPSEGVEAAVALASSGRYQVAWRYLVETGDGLGWYDRLMQAGWHAWSTEALEEFSSIRRTVQARTADVPVDVQVETPRWGVLGLIFGSACAAGALLWASTRS